MSTAILRERFGGTWDGGEHEIHGLIQHHGDSLKIELLRASKWRCSIFAAGACVATTDHDNAQTAVELALAALDH